MRVLLLSSFFYPHYGGSQRYMEELYAHLIRLDPTVKVDVVCYNTDRVTDQESYRGLNIYRVPCWQVLPGQFALPNYFSLVILLKRLSAQHHYDIVHSNTRFFDHSWWTPLLAKILKARSILTDHCADYPAHSSKFINEMAKVLDKVGVLLSARFYNLTTVTNQATWHFALSIGLKDPVVVYGGVDVKFFKPREGKRKRIIPKVNQQFNGRQIIVSFVGRMIQTKGPQLLLKAAQRLVKNNPNLHFVFAGGGKMYDELKGSSCAQIHFTEALNQQEVAKLLKNTDIFVHPSLHHEGFPNAILEAGASGCAVVATDNGGTKEVIVHGKTGLLVQPAVQDLEKALQGLIEDHSLREKLGRALRQRIEENFDWEIVTQDFRKLLIDKGIKVWNTIGDRPR